MIKQFFKSMWYVFSCFFAIVADLIKNKSRHWLNFKAWLVSVSAWCGESVATSILLFGFLYILPVEFATGESPAPFDMDDMEPSNLIAMIFAVFFGMILTCVRWGAGKRCE